MTPQPEARPLAYELQSAERLTGISRSQLYELIKRGELPIVKVGRRTLITDDDLQALITRRRVARTATRPSASRAAITERT
jgi:excisionase family DNA binding protein